MKKHKLSSTQIWVIEKMQKGDILHYIDGINPRCFFNTQEGVLWSTIYKLERLGLVFRGQGKIELTERGKSISLTVIVPEYLFVVFMFYWLMFVGTFG